MLAANKRGFERHSVLAPSSPWQDSIAYSTSERLLRLDFCFHRIDLASMPRKSRNSAKSRDIACAPLEPAKAEQDAALDKELDVIAPDLKVLFCGIQPGRYSAAAGRFYSKSGNRFWPAMHLSGFTEKKVSPEDQQCVFCRRRLACSVLTSLLVIVVSLLFNVFSLPALFPTSFEELSSTASSVSQP